MERSPNSLQRTSNDHNLDAEATEGVAGATLGRISRQLANRTGVASYLLPREKREIARQLQEEHESQVVNLGLQRLNAEANTRIVDLELAAERQRTETLVAHNQRMGDLKRQEQQLVAKALAHVVAAEQRDQRELAAYDVLPEDREMLAAYYRQRAADEMQSIASAHGVTLATPDADAPPASQ
ncbi:MAG: hypothetical protein KDA61_21100 [Planctomycetales bacterium]|nr:hypothetical protein [Planctomycetales bacterium]